jgi:hypothetical protein
MGFGNHFVVYHSQQSVIESNVPIGYYLATNVPCIVNLFEPPLIICLSVHYWHRCLNSAKTMGGIENNMS